MTFIDTIEKEMRTDDISRKRQENYFLNRYKNYSKNEKEVIDEFLICLCGWSFNTILNKKTD